MRSTGSRESRRFVFVLRSSPPAPLDYGACLLGAHGELQSVPAGTKGVLGHGGTHGWAPVDKASATMWGPHSTCFAEGNGGEMRRSYHGYPHGAQLLFSPSTFQIEPMQIDTLNREQPGPPFLPGPLPASAPFHNGMTTSPLLECPCTTRVKREVHHDFSLARGRSCTQAVADAKTCFAAARALQPGAPTVNRSITDPSLPTACSVLASPNGTVEALWNPSGSATCQAPAGPRVGIADSPLVALTVNLTSGSATLRLKGPADVWFGVGFGAASMCLLPEADLCPGGGPYAIIVAGDNVTERKLDDHGPGVLLRPSVTVASNSVVDGERTVVLTRPLQGPTGDHYSFDLNATSAWTISAQGTSLAFGPHRAHAVTQLTLLAVGQPACACDDGVRGSLNGVPFSHGQAPLERCPPPPLSDLSYQHNPTCSVETYQGGLWCCLHGTVLLDEGQAPPASWEEQEYTGDLQRKNSPVDTASDSFLPFFQPSVARLCFIFFFSFFVLNDLQVNVVIRRYQLKFRFYFEDYDSRVHRNLERLYWQTEDAAGEYDVEPCAPGTPPAQCVHVITSRFPLTSMLHNFDRSLEERYAGVELAYAGPHCHAPACLSMDLYVALARIHPKTPERAAPRV